MSELATILRQARYFRSKDVELHSVRVLERAKLTDDAEWLLVAVEGIDAPYQMVVDAALTRDVLTDAEVATALLSHLEVLGHVEVFIQPVLPEHADARGMGVEQSNTSLIVGDEVALKVFRQLEPGPNRDVDTLQGLQRVGSPVIPPLRGVWTKNGCVTAYAQDLVRNATDAWDCAAEVDQRQLREVTERMHRDLAEAFGTDTVTGAQIADSLIARFPESEHVQQYRDKATAVFNRVRDMKEVPVQRIHGDYHLGQVLAAEGALYVIDFEGEPARPLAERNRPDSPLRDIAGMIRSLDYAGLDYSEYAAGSRENSALLDAYILDKALYEVAYEAANRPDWIHIPLRAVQQLLGA